MNWSAAEVIVGILGILGGWLFGLWTHKASISRQDKREEQDREDTRQIRTERINEGLRHDISSMGDRLTKHITETTVELRRYIDAQDRATVSHLDGRLDDMERHSKERHESTAQVNRDLFASRAEMAAVSARLDIIERRVKLHTSPPPRRYRDDEDDSA